MARLVLRYDNNVNTLIGRAFGKLVVIRVDPETRHLNRHRRRWVCACICGKVLTVSQKRLLDKEEGTKSCGCGIAEANRRRTKNPADKRTAHPLYYLWCGMRNRCHDTKGQDYHLYGERGIVVCARWADFEKFVEDMGPRPSPRHSIGRIDNNGNYEPGNCRWETPKEQMSNTRINRYVTQGETTLIESEWDRRLGFSVGTVRMRRRRGVPEHRLLDPLRTQFNESS